MSLLRTRSVMLVKIEVTYDTDPTPTGADDAVAVENLEISFPPEVLDRDRVRTTLSPEQPMLGRKFGQISCDVELKGSGSAGVAADWGPLARISSLDETIAASTSVTYDPISDAIESGTCYAYYDGLLYKFTGCRANQSFTFAAGQRPMMHFDIQGHCLDVIDAALPSVTIDATKPGVVTGSSFTVGGYAATIANLTVDLQNQLGPTDDINDPSGYGEFKITKRDTAGSFDPEATLVATHDFWSDWEDSTTQALSIAVSNGSGNIATLTAPKVVNRELSVGDRNGILIHEIPFTCAYDSGDDEIQLVMT